MAELKKKMRYLKSTVLAVLFLSWTALYCRPFCPETHGMRLGDFQVSPFVMMDSEDLFYAGSVTAASISDRTVLKVVHPLFQKEQGGLSGDVRIGFEHFVGGAGNFIFYIEENLNLPFSESVYGKKDNFTYDYGIYFIQTSFRTIYSFPGFSIYGEFSHFFMSHDRDDLFDSLSLDVSEKKTWTSLFGLSPFYKDSFTSADSRAFDWYEVTVGPRTVFNRLKMELLLCYCAPYSAKNSLEHIPLQGFSPLMLFYPGGEWLINETFSISFGAGYKLLGVSGYPRYSAYCSAAVVF